MNNQGGEILGLVIFIAAGLTLFLIWYYARKKHRAEKAAFDAWAMTAGYRTITEQQRPELSLSSFSQGAILRGIHGLLTEAQNYFCIFVLTETRGSGRNRRNYQRSIISVNIPDTRLQLIINSKINNDWQSGGNIARYSKEQRFTLEGDFGVFFDILMPDTTQSESLTMLAPNSMVYIMKHFSNYDIEINGSKIYLYTYKHLRHNDMAELLPKLNHLLTEMRLRKDDVRDDHISGIQVARTVTHAHAHHRSLRRDVQYLSVVFFIGLFVLQMLPSSIGPIYIILYFGAMFYFIGKVLYDLATEARLRRKYRSVISHYK